MLRTASFGLAVQFLILSGTPSHALDTQELARQCQNSAGNARNTTAVEDREGFFCLGVILGAYSVMNANCANGNSRLTAGRMPSLGAGAQAYLNYVSSNPARWGDPAMNSVFAALAQAFPCRN